MLAAVARANCCVEVAGSSSIVRGLWRAWTALMASALGTARPSGPECISLSLYLSLSLLAGGVLAWWLLCVFLFTVASRVG
jgi:hypothetical protein